MTKPDRPKLDLATLRRLPRGIWALGLVSLWMDVSSEMIHALLPVYLVSAMGASMVTVGFIEGIAEAAAAITKVFSGALSDWLGKRKVLAVVGYGLAALTKPIFPLAPTIGWLVGARFIDRVGKGIRGAPRDALVADLSPAGMRGASYGLRQSLDTVGAFLGPLAAVALMWLTAGNIPLVFWAAVAPAAVSVLLLVTLVPEPARPAEARPVKSPLSPRELRRMGGAFWWVVAVASVFTLARFSEAFLILKAHAEGVPAGLVPVVLVIMNVSYALSAFPAGVLSDNGSRLRVLALGMGLLIGADLAFALLPGLGGVLAGLVLWGLHMGFTQGIFASLVADTAPPALRGTGFGMLNLMTGGMILLASVIAGLLWDSVGPQGTFLAGGGLAVLALAGLMPLRRALHGHAAERAETGQ
ncbi:MFS transporter [Actibacterium sp. MT2.3-13A]|uniref:MFS transporter n=1 Tax=Actibacterium sp. MT2.3-13A TaxID=2828332 RepID=UPI001BAB4723|nr:MFS transporter [Actibacterium sp. MT2.3-13A]